MASVKGYFLAMLPASIRYKIRIKLNRVLVTTKSLNILNWISKSISTDLEERTWRGSQNDLDKLNLYLSAATPTTIGNPTRAYKANFYGFPVIGAYKVPIYLDAIVDLKQGPNPILETLGENVRRLIRRGTSTYDIKVIDDHSDIDMVNKLMLIPYGNSRHGSTAVNLDEGGIYQLLSGRAHGKLHVLYNEGVAVGCHLGYESREKRGKVWNALRFGYVSEVFNDSKRLDEANTLNAYLAMCWAHSQGYDFYNFGMSGGNLADGLLRWKLRRGGVPDVERTVDFFYLKLQRGGAPYFYWHMPAIIVYKNELCLCIGQPSDIDFNSLKSRYKKCLPNGIATILLHRSKIELKPTQSNEFAKYVQSYFPSAKIRVFDY